jgi:hypothetical protein
MRSSHRAVSPRPSVLLAVALLAALPAHAGVVSAQAGVNLSWSRCSGEGVGTQNRAFACDTNTGQEVLVASFVLDQDMAQVSGNEVVLDLLSQADPLPAWWDLKNIGSCRATSLGMNTTANAGDVVCVDWAQGGSTGGIGAYDTETPNGNLAIASRHRRLKIALAVPISGLADLVAGTEYFSCNIVINHLHTVGTGACAGCAIPACIVLNSIKVTTPSPGSDRTLGAGTTAGSNIVTWQAGVADCSAVPTRQETWGAVKALYR